MFIETVTGNSVSSTKLLHIPIRSIPLPFQTKKRNLVLPFPNARRKDATLYTAPCMNRRLLNLRLVAPLVNSFVFGLKYATGAEFHELKSSGGVKVLDIRDGSGKSPLPGDKVAIHYTGRLAAKQGWRFDSTYDHKNDMGIPEPFVFVVASGFVISGLDAAVRTMKVGGLRRVVIPPKQGYQTTSQEPVPPNLFDRQRLFTTIFNPTRLSNGEGSTLGTLVFDIELLSIWST